MMMSHDKSLMDDDSLDQETAHNNTGTNNDSTDHDGNAPPPPLTLRIREREMVVPVQVSPEIDNVWSLKQRLLNVNKHSSSSGNNMNDKNQQQQQQQQSHQQQQTMTTNKNNPYVRLIAAGRLLAPDTALLKDFSLSDNQVIHAVILEQKPVNSNVAADNDDEDDEEEEGVYYREETDVGVLELDQMETGTSTNSTSSTSSTTTRVRRNHQQQAPRQRTPLGFDRLRTTANLRRTEISVLRMYFNGQIDAFLRDHPEIVEELHRQEGTDTLRRRRLAEEAWMAVQSPTSEFALNVTTVSTAVRSWTNGTSTTTTTINGRATRNGGAGGTDREFAWGFLLGYFVGYYMLIWMWIPSIPHRQKMGILAGYCMQLATGLLKSSSQIGVVESDNDYLDDALLGLER